jgi:hypothetical protein
MPVRTKINKKKKEKDLRQEYISLSGRTRNHELKTQSRHSSLPSAPSSYRVENGDQFAKFT